MSASREKIRRRELASSPEAAQPAKKGMSKGLKTFLTVVCVLLVVCVIAFFTLLTSGFFATHSTAAVASGHKLSPVMVNYFYRNSYQNMANQYGDYLQYFLDTNTPLTQQYYDEENGVTWADYLLDQGLDEAASLYAVYNKAVDAGYTLTEDDKAQIESELSYLDLSAVYQGFSNADSYLAGMFGPGCSKKTYRTYLEQSTLATSYSDSIADSLVYTAEEIENAYNADRNSYDSVSYRVFTVNDNNFGMVDDVKDLAKMKEDMASEMAEQSKNDEDAFILLAAQNAPADQKETYLDDSATLRSNISYSSVPTAIVEWLFDDARTEGETTYLATSEGAESYYVLYFISRSDNNYQLPNVRHILITVASDADEETDAAAKQKAEDLLNEYLSGEKTAEAFAALAEANTEDTGSAQNGGLYENVTPGAMVTEFNDWCFDETRQPGDTGIVKTSYGYHVMYFDGYGDVYRDTLVRNALKSADYQAWLNEATQDASLEKKPFGMRFVSK